MEASTQLKNFTAFKDLKSESEKGENAVFIDEEALKDALRQSHKSVVSITHEQNIICSKTLICRQLFCRSHGGLSVKEKEGKSFLVAELTMTTGRVVHLTFV